MSFLLSIRMASISCQGPTLSLNIGTLPVSVLLCPTLATPWTVARQAPLSMGFLRQGYWSGSPFPPAGDLSDPGIETAVLVSAPPALAGGFFNAVPRGKPSRY